MSDSKGHVYLIKAREVMKEELEPFSLVQEQWTPVTNGSLPEIAVNEIAKALLWSSASQGSTKNLHLSLCDWRIG